MFLTIVHQLNFVNSEHDKLASVLRADITNFITQNMPMFEYELRDRVYEHLPQQKVSNMSEECQKFVNDTLSKEGVWGGIETLSALQILRKVNILVINECGDFYLIGEYNDSYGIVLMAYRLAGTATRLKTNLERNHYDSIVCIEPDDLFTIAETITRRINHKHINQSLKTDLLSPIVLE